MVRQHHLLDVLESEQTPGDSGGQRSLAYCSPWSNKESDVTQQLNDNNKLVEKPLVFLCLWENASYLLDILSFLGFFMAWHLLSNAGLKGLGILLLKRIYEELQKSYGLKNAILGFMKRLQWLEQIVLKTLFLRRGYNTDYEPDNLSLEEKNIIRSSLMELDCSE